MAKHLIDVDEALRLGTTQRKQRIAAALDRLGAADLANRADAWR